MKGQVPCVAVALIILVGADRLDAAPIRPIDPMTVGACIRAASPNRPWLERTLWGLYDQERGWVGAEILNRDGSRDLGPMQVNSQWAPTVASILHRDPPDVYRWLRDDACFNVGVASWLFLAGYRRAADYWRAVGAYHSPTNWRARGYAIDVAAKLRKRYGAEIFQPPEPRSSSAPAAK